jgi:hypothetical protein
MAQLQAKIPPRGRLLNLGKLARTAALTASNCVEDLFAIVVKRAEEDPTF